MAFITYTTDVPAGDRTGSNKIGDNLYFASGEWAGNGGTGAAGDEIDLATDFGATHIVACGVYQSENVTDIVMFERNMEGDGTAGPGMIGITACTDTGNNVGHWWAIFQIG